MWLFDFNRMVAGLILGASYPFLTLLGLHWGFTPITLQNLNEFGGDIVEGVNVCAVFAEIGIAIGAYLKAKKNSRIRNVAGPAILTGIFAGVTEPILYGVVMNYKRMLAIVAIAGGIGGAVNGMLHVTCDAFVFHNIFSLAMRTYSPFTSYLLGISASLAAGVLLTYFWGVTPDDMEAFEPEDEDDSEKAAETADTEPAGDTGMETGMVLEIHAPLTGETVALQDVPDEVFASGVAGLGMAVRPLEGKVAAPCNAEVSVVFPSRHAIGLTTAEGADLLIHIGLNTVMLDGEGFEVLVKEGDRVHTGQPLLKFDMDLIQEKGYSLISPVLVSNADEFADIHIVADGSVKAGETLYQVVK